MGGSGGGVFARGDGCSGFVLFAGSGEFRDDPLWDDPFQKSRADSGALAADEIILGVGQRVLAYLSRDESPAVPLLPILRKQCLPPGYSLLMV